MKHLAMLSLSCVLLTACMEEAGPRTGDPSDVAVASVALSNLPASVRCIEINVQRGTQLISSRTQVAGQAQAIITIARLPLGSATFSALAYGVNCNTLLIGAPSWQSDPVAVELTADRVPDIELTLYPIRSPEVHASFQPDVVEIAQCGAALIAQDSADQLYASGILEIATPAASLSGAAVSSVACSEYFGCVVADNGNVSCFGLNYRVLPSAAESVTTPLRIGTFTAESISVGSRVACAVTTGGASVVCWGSNADGFFNPAAPSDSYVGPTTAPVSSSLPFYNIRQVAVSTRGACALTSNGSVVCWGSNAHRLLVDPGVLNPDPNLTYYVQLAFTGVTDSIVELVASGEGMYGLTANGRLARWGEDRMQPELVPDLNDVVDVAAANDSVCVLRATGQVFCWGRGEAGAHGDGANQLTRPAATTPVLLDPELPPVVSISGHFRSYCALHENGLVSCWGDNVFGALADGTTDVAYVPVLAERWDVRLDSPPVVPPIQ